MKPYPLIMLALVTMTFLAITPLSRAVDEGEDGVKVLSFEVTEGKAFSLLALIPEKSTYKPGEVVTITFGCYVPSNTRYVYFRIENTAGTQLYYKDVTSLFNPNTCTVVKATFTAPNTAGNYKMYADFRDGQNQIIYTDQGTFSVSTSTTTTCPSGYCTNWANTQRVTNGWQQTKSCYHYAQGTCTVTAYNTYRVVCDNGYQLGKSNQCEPIPTTAPACGDGIVQTGESCDDGMDNGVCPNKCNSFCQVSSCSTIPGFDTCTNNPNLPECKTGGAPVDEGFEFNYTTLLIVGLLGGGAYMVVKNKKR